jgi:hypothetical protein
MQLLYRHTARPGKRNPKARKVARAGRIVDRFSLLIWGCIVRANRYVEGLQF